MSEEKIKYSSWNFYSILAILIFSLLQIARARLFPQFMDTYYHIHTAWGFIKAGGYSTWDFWQYAPAGRPHIYPPLFHVILAALIKLGANKVILAKLLETVAPVCFLSALWNFIRKNFGERFAFFVTLVFGSSFSYYLSLIDHLPSTFALILGLFGLGRLFRARSVSAIILFCLSFYTHIGVSWFLILSVIFYGILNSEARKRCFFVASVSLALSGPVILRQIISLKYMQNLGFSIPEAYVLRIKIVDYILAFLGIFLVFKAGKIYRLFLGMFIASFIFLLYPKRFFSYEGYLPIMLLSAFSWHVIYEQFAPRIKRRVYFIGLFLILVLVVSPTLVLNTGLKEIKQKAKLEFFNSAVLGMFFARGESIWFPQEYMSAVRIIKENSADNDIVFSTLNNMGVALAAFSGRPTANALLPEIGPAYRLEPFMSSKIIVFMQDDDRDLINLAVSRYNLVKIGENKLFLLYRNQLAGRKTEFKRALVPFWAFFLALALLFAIFLKAELNKKFI